MSARAKGERAILSIRNIYDAAARHKLEILAVLAWVSLLLLGGCGAQQGLGPGTAAGALAAPEAPDASLPLKAAYELEGERREVIFLEVAGASDDAYNRIADDLFDELSVDVLPAEDAFRGELDLPALTPVDPETGLVGVSLTLREMAAADDGEYTATVSFARSGLDGGDITFVLHRAEQGWSVAEYSHGSRG